MFDTCHQAPDRKHILVLFIEGSRSEPEQLNELKRGIHHLIKTRSTLTVVPVMMHGLGKALPKGEAILVPFNCDIVVGEALPFVDDAKQYLNNVSNALKTLLDLCLTRQHVVEDD